MRFQRLDLDALILASQKPTRYVGGEVNSRSKPLNEARLTWALCFPETYEVGMSNVGFRLLHFVLNEQPSIACERAFMPWPDMIERMRTRRVPLWSLESRAPLADFDVLGFSLQFEAGYTSVLEMLDLAGVPLFACERTVDDPGVIGGGPCAYNPEPLAPFFDAFSIGEGERQLVEISQVVAAWRDEVGQRGDRDRAREPRSARERSDLGEVLELAISGQSDVKDERRAELLERLSRVPGVYVPSLFRPRWDARGRLEEMAPLRAGYERVTRSAMSDLDEVPQPSRPIVPFMQTIHDRLPIEIQRGCVRGCRFCQAGMLTRPSRQRSPDRVLRLATEGLKATGYEEVGFLSLSAGDYGCINALLESFFDRFAPERVAISLPSLRTETMTEKLAEQIGRVKKSGFTIAPEAATDRLRRVINKGNSEENLLKAIESTFRSGWSLIKLYFMIGLPTETDEDVAAIAELAKRAYRLSRGIRSGAQINVAVSTFIPKPFTPFQWDAMISREETFRRHDLLRDRFPKKGGLILCYHEGQSSLVEGALARGDRRVARAVFEAWREGQILDGWSEHFDFTRWTRASQVLQARHGVQLGDIATRERDLDECLPWSRIDCGVSEAFLRRERDKSRAEELTPTCASGQCAGCGACDFKTLQNRLKADEAARDGWQGDKRQAEEAPASTANQTDPRQAKGCGPLVAGIRGLVDRMKALVAHSDSAATEEAPGIETAADAANPSDRNGTTDEDPGAQHWARISYGKEGRAIAVSHLETITLFTRALRRAGWPVAFTRGFHPKPRLSFSPACPVGIESNCEYIDVQLSRACDDDALFESLARELPDNFPLNDVSTQVGKQKAPSEAITAFGFDAIFPRGHGIDLAAAIADFEARDTFVIQRPGSRVKPARDIDLKAALLSLELNGQNHVSFTLRAGNKASAKPVEVIEGIFGVKAATGEGVALSKSAAFWGDVGWWEWFVEPGQRIISIESDREAPTYVSSLIVEDELDALPDDVLDDGGGGVQGDGEDPATS